MKNNIITVFIESFYRSAVIDEGDDDLAVLGGRLFAHDDFVAVEDAGVDHAGSDYVEHEQIVPAETSRRERVIVLIVFIGEDGLPRGNGTDKGNVDGGVFAEVYRSVFVRRLGKQSFLVQLFHVIISGGSRLDVQFCANFPYRGRIAVFGVVFVYKVQYGLHFVAAFFRHDDGHLLFGSIIPQTVQKRKQMFIKNQKILIGPIVSGGKNGSAEMCAVRQGLHRVPGV